MTTKIKMNSLIFRKRNRDSEDELSDSSTPSDKLSSPCKDADGVSTRKSARLAKK